MACWRSVPYKDILPRKPWTLTACRLPEDAESLSTELYSRERIYFRLPLALAVLGTFKAPFYRYKRETTSQIYLTNGIS
jgi:hypothetical protein